MYAPRYRAGSRARSVATTFLDEDLQNDLVESQNQRLRAIRTHFQDDCDVARARARQTNQQADRDFIRAMSEISSRSTPATAVVPAAVRRDRVGRTTLYTVPEPEVLPTSHLRAHATPRYNNETFRLPARPPVSLRITLDEDLEPLTGGPLRRSSSWSSLAGGRSYRGRYAVPIVSSITQRSYLDHAYLPPLAGRRHHLNTIIVPPASRHLTSMTGGRSSGVFMARSRPPLPTGRAATNQRHVQMLYRDPDMYEDVHRRLRNISLAKSSSTSDLLNYQIPTVSYKELREKMRDISDNMGRHRRLLDNYSALDMSKPSDVAGRIEEKSRQVQERMAMTSPRYR